MKHFCSSENYLSLAEIEKISASDSVKVVFYPNGEFYSIRAYLCDVFLGTTRFLKRLPKYSKFPRLFLRAHSNRWLVEHFDGILEKNNKNV